MAATSFRHSANDAKTEVGQPDGQSGGCTIEDSVSNRLGQLTIRLGRTERINNRDRVVRTSSRGCVPVAAPFPCVAVKVVEAPCTWRFQSTWTELKVLSVDTYKSLPASCIECEHPLVNLVSHRVLRGHSGAAQVLPLGFSWKPVEPSIGDHSSKIPGVVPAAGNFEVWPLRSHAGGRPS